MNENDLSDEALEQWRIKTRLMTPYGSVAAAWNEAIRRAKANPWQLFSDEQLEVLNARLEGAALAGEPIEHCLVEGIEAELERRKSK